MKVEFSFPFSFSNELQNESRKKTQKEENNNLYIIYIYGWDSSSSLSSIVQFPSLLDDCFGAGGGASFLGGIRSFILSKPLASSKLAILWFGEKPANAILN